MTLPQTDDEDLRRAIMDESDPAAFVDLIHRYYFDRTRAEATSRELMYIHIGMACGMIMRLLNRLGL